MKRDLIPATLFLVLLAGCDSMVEKPYGPPAMLKVVAAPYHIEFDVKASKPNPTGVALAAISYTGNPKALEKRAALVVRFDATGSKNDQPGKDRLITTAFDIPGTGGTVPLYYLETADQDLAKMLGDRCMKGKIKVSVALVRSTIRPDPDESEINAKRLSDWVPAEVAFRNPHPKC